MMIIKKIFSFINYLIKRIDYVIKLKIKKDEFIMAVDKWFKDKGDSTLRVNYNLSEDSIVVDVGGYIGEWTLEIFQRYNCNIYI